MNVTRISFELNFLGNEKMLKNVGENRMKKLLKK